MRSLSDITHIPKFNIILDLYNMYLIGDFPWPCQQLTKVSFMILNKNKNIKTFHFQQEITETVGHHPPVTISFILQ